MQCFANRRHFLTIGDSFFSHLHFSWGEWACILMTAFPCLVGLTQVSQITQKAKSLRRDSNYTCLTRSMYKICELKELCFGELICHLKLALEELKSYCFVSFQSTGSVLQYKRIHCLAEDGSIVKMSILELMQVLLLPGL